MRNNLTPGVYIGESRNLLWVAGDSVSEEVGCLRPEGIKSGFEFTI